MKEQGTERPNRADIVTDAVGEEVTNDKGVSSPTNVAPVKGELDGPTEVVTGETRSMSIVVNCPTVGASEAVTGESTTEGAGELRA